MMFFEDVHIYFDNGHASHDLAVNEEQMRWDF